MMSKALEIELLKNLELLNKEQQEKALDYIKNLLNRNNQSHLLQLAGSIDPISLNEMKKAIESDCEKIDGNEW